MSQPVVSPFRKSDTEKDDLPSGVIPMAAVNTGNGVLRNAEGNRLIPGPNNSYFEDPRDLYEIESSLGQGSYGHVVLALHKRSGIRYAIKILPINSALDSNGAATQSKEIAAYEREVHLLQDGADCPYLVHLVETYQFSKEIWIVMEYCEAGSLESIMKNTPARCFNESQVAAICKMLVLGLLHMHRKKKIHRDIKAANILVNAKGQVKIADFGLSRVISATNAQARTLCGTPYYVAPELCKTQPYGNVVDLWSLGILAIVMLTGNVPAFIHGRPPQQVMGLIAASTFDNYSIPGKLKDEDFNPFVIHNLREQGVFYGANQNWKLETLDFLKACLQTDPKKRWSADELLMHPFIFDVPRYLKMKTPEKKTVTVLSVLERPTHNAFPVFSNYRPDKRNLAVVFSKEDYGNGAAHVFLEVVEKTMKFIESKRQKFPAKQLDMFKLRDIGVVQSYTRGNAIESYTQSNETIKAAAAERERAKEMEEAQEKAFKNMILNNLPSRVTTDYTIVNDTKIPSTSNRIDLANE